jgi:diguanylate cyclase (GGDEF)-like protein
MDTSKSPIESTAATGGETAVLKRDEDALSAGRAGNTEGQLAPVNTAVIMMVDDEPTTIEVLEAFLEGEGYENFVTTNDPREALPLLEIHRPDVLLLDLNMPNMSGLEVLTLIRNDQALQHTPVIILTSSTEEETKLEALELGASEFLGKPVDPSELALRLRNTLATKAYQDHLTHYDGLTGLPNRGLFMERTDRALERAGSKATECAVLHIDLDRFKQINEVLGRRVGDAVLKAVAERLEKSVRVSDLLGTAAMQTERIPLSRVGGDEFLLFLPEIHSVDRAALIARRILSDMSEPFFPEGQDLFVTSSIGIALFPGDGKDAETLAGNAGVALSHAKQRGGNDYQFYSKSLNAESWERLSLENQLRKALDRGELRLYYQPKVDFKTGQIIGSEALMRWQHPELGLVPPQKFIPIAEETGLITSLGDWALRTACQQNKAWQSAGFRAIQVSVNVSSKQFRPGELQETIRDALQASGMEARQLVLEVTESLLIENPESSLEMLREIKAMGLKISVDDFGTGYSSLSYLKRLPLDELKIDRSFVNGIPTDADDVAIVTAIIAMAHSLGLSVVAEGVETEEHLAFLAERGCDEYQGFLFSRPLPASQWTALFRKDAGIA